MTELVSRLQGAATPRTVTTCSFSSRIHLLIGQADQAISGAAHRELELRPLPAFGRCARNVPGAGRHPPDRLPRGAVATQVRVGEPWLLFPAVLGGSLVPERTDRRVAAAGELIGSDRPGGVAKRSSLPIRPRT
jgi:hypothetical protein